MDDPEQLEFLLMGTQDGSSSLEHPLGDLLAQVQVCWSLPIGQRVHVDLAGAEIDFIEGRLDLIRAPESPLNAAHPLALRVAHLNFSSRQIKAWSLL
jgi:hypothetical protein